MSDYEEFTGKSVEEALRNARDRFGVGLDELDFEILTSGSRGVLGMGAEPARIVAAPRSALGGAAPKRAAAEAAPLPARPRQERGPRRDDRERPRQERGPRRDDRAPLPAAARERHAGAAVSSAEEEMVHVSRSVVRERDEIQAAEASPAALDAGKAILERLMDLLGFDVSVAVESGETSRLNVIGVSDEDHEALGALIGRKGERLSALQHIVNLMLSREMGEWTRVLVDVEGYRGRREQQLREIALRAAGRVAETGKMLQLEAMPALERRWIHIALRDHPAVGTQSIGEEPNRRVVVIPRSG
jgi:spoIIIJ-associated protein